MELKKLKSIKDIGYALLIVGTPPAETELISGAESSKMMNMGLWFGLMTFVASAGGRIGGLGVKLMREIKIEVKNED
ncbi:MAG: hypothetical protein OIN87_07520 [Candidatus Methanoperedens sp.]|nr:hypothetical protein [Candidatus Methanoperedens sp.]